MNDFNFQLGLPQLFHDLAAYLSEHPVVLGGIGLLVLLAVVGAWYVLSHHLHVLLTTLLCISGFAAGMIVLYRGIELGMRDLIAIGAFLMVIFPVIFQQAVKVARIAFGDNAFATGKGHAKRAGMASG